MKNMDRDANVLSWRLFFNWRYTHADGVGEVRVQEVEDLDSSFVHVQPPSGIRWRRGYGGDMLDYFGAQRGADVAGYTVFIIKETRFLFKMYR